MNNVNVSDELLSKFLEGKTNEAEEAETLRRLESDNVLIDEMVAVGEAAKLADTEPLVAPDLALAEERVRSALQGDTAPKAAETPRIFHFRPRVYWAAAASLALILTVTLVLRQQPEPSGAYIAKNNGDSAMPVKRTAAQEVVANPSGTPQDAVAPASSASGSHAVTSDSLVLHEAWKGMEQVAGKEEVKGAHAQPANVLHMVKPAKSSYSVLCKNLDKSFAFEWSAVSVRELRFAVTDAKGRQLVSVTDRTAEKHLLKYRDIFPERQLKWELSVVFQDGGRESRSGQIQIDYQLQ